jgi:hypothetical protein
MAPQGGTVLLDLLSVTERLSVRSLDPYRALTVSIAEDESFCNFLADKIAAQDEFQARPLSPAQESTIYVLYQLIHMVRPDAQASPIRPLAKGVNFELERRGEPSGLNERKFGDILTSLAFTNRTRRNTGYVLWLDRAARARIHATARDYRIEGTGESSIDDCQICTPITRPTPVTRPATTTIPGEDQKMTHQIS